MRIQTGNKKRVQIFIATFFLFVACLFLGKRVAAAESVNIQLNVHVCNSNLICEAVIGETYGSCPSDCEPPPPATTTPTTTPPDSGGNSGNSGNGPVQSSGTTGVFYGQNDLINPIGQTNKPEQIFPKGIKGDMLILPYRDRVQITFDTYLPTLLTTSWGGDLTYGIGSSVENSYHQKFNIDIANLDAGVTYYFKLHLVDTLGRVVEYEKSFTTSAIENFSTLPVVKDLNIVDVTVIDSAKNGNKAGVDSVLEHDLSIGWRNPDLKSTERIRLVRLSDKYPIDPYEGRVIYEGRGERVLDRGLLEGDSYYYALFIVDRAGNYSAPAVVRFTPKKIQKNNIDKNSADKINKNNLINKDGLNNQGVYDPLIQNTTPLIVEITKNNPERLGFCGPLKIPQTITLSEGAINPDENVAKTLITFFQNGKKSKIVRGIIEAEKDIPLVLRVAKKDVDISAQRLGICLVSDVSDMESYYLFTKDQNGDFELVFPAHFEKTVEKKHYQFTLGMIKFNGQESIIGKGEITYMPKVFDSNSGVQKLITIVSIALVIFVTRFIVLLIDLI